jgi:predicted nucleic acid-binding protein
MTVIADTGFVVAVAISSDADHERCVAVYDQQREIFLPQSTLTEIGYLLVKAGGNQAMGYFLSNLFQMKYKLIALENTDITRTGELLIKYADSRVDFVDASIAAVAERLKITRILTLDYRDFRIIRPRHCDYFELLPTP